MISTRGIIGACLSKGGGTGKVLGDLRDLARTMQRGLSAKGGVSGMYAELEPYGLETFEVLDLIEEEGYKANAFFPPSCTHRGAWAGKTRPASALHGGAGES